MFTIRTYIYVHTIIHNTYDSAAIDSDSAATGSLDKDDEKL